MRVTPIIKLIVTAYFSPQLHATGSYRAAFTFEAERVLPQVPCPTLYLVTEGDILRSKNEAAVELTPKGEARVIDIPYGQYPARHPEEFSSEVLAFLGRIGYL